MELLSILALVKTGVSALFPDMGKEKADQLQKVLSEAEIKMEALVNETKGNWFQRSWRPILMFMIIFLLFHNFFILPYLNLIFGVPLQAFTFPDRLWTMLEIGLGGYVGLRTVEKVAGKAIKHFKRKERNR